MSTFAEIADAPPLSTTETLCYCQLYLWATHIMDQTGPRFLTNGFERLIVPLNVLQQVAQGGDFVGPGVRVRPSLYPTLYLLIDNTLRGA